MKKFQSLNTTNFPSKNKEHHQRREARWCSYKKIGPKDEEQQSYLQKSKFTRKERSQQNFAKKHQNHFKKHKKYKRSKKEQHYQKRNKIQASKNEK